MKDIVRKKYELAFDELNKLVGNEYETGTPNSLKELIESLIILGYKQGRESAEDLLDFTLDSDLDLDLLEDVLNKTYKDKGYAEKVEEYALNGSVGRIKVLAESEFHRAFNTGQLDGAREIAKETGRSIRKRWVTVLDEKVRDTHEYLEGVDVALEEEFHTFDGDKALYPSGFEKAENNVNCRCVLDLF